ncbi:hypothetical protein GTA08_BOTSDO00556 [Neofusicoccum parvum]|uniref:Uncharacterized protein n=2 Tax=Neofusicoccum parvum TaxID=310453 RepID=R1EC11_BOTPV|nr:hypothetical protein UCRNP2_7943 [Neofusicoccum parvum UCRNP2]GME40922.1 hypothetical protein GTA08_BOTSDO00556 [Neofusicoccum parvum]GME64234.1 hypothetical protein GTA08_BOTSDO00556 [Neofusicoccum parvum]
MVLQTRQSDFLPTMYTYDPSKAPNLSGRKRQHKSYRSRPATRASSFVRSPHISTMVEENEEADEQAGSSSSSTKSNSSDSSTQSQYLEMARTASNRAQQQQDAAAPEIPARNPARNSMCSQRASISSAHEIKYDSVAASIKSVEEEEKKATPVAPAATDRTESPGPKSKKRNWFSKKRAAGPVEAH